MQWIHIKAVFESDNLFLAEELISDLFFSLGFKGVVCQVPLPEPEEGFGSNAVPQPDENAISGYLPNIPSSEKSLERIREKGAHLKKNGIKIRFSTEPVDQEAWAESWKRFFPVTRITDKIVIKPNWLDFSPRHDDIIIDIDPGMAFGTGTHPTTFMCIEMIESHLEKGYAFLDVGCGSGILMIAAAKLGAGVLCGLDIDELAVRIAGENLAKNRIDPETIHLIQGSLDLLDYHKTFDCIAANILAETIIEILPELRKHLKPSGILILSGIIKDKEPLVIAHLETAGLRLRESRSSGEWVALAAK